jgi:hypothetical protein
LNHENDLIISDTDNGLLSVMNKTLLLFYCQLLFIVC